LGHFYPAVLRNIKCISRYSVEQQFWQKRCYDHNCRTNETVLENIKYCHKNPVTRGLVKDPGDWQWSAIIGILVKTMFL
jgi:putative transposase